MANTNETFRKYVLQEAVQKLFAGKSPGADFVIVFVILPAKGHFRIADRNNPMVGYSDTVRIAGQVMQNMLGSAKRGLGVDNPVLSRQVV